MFRACICLQQYVLFHASSCCMDSSTAFDRSSQTHPQSPSQAFRNVFGQQRQFLLLPCDLCQTCCSRTIHDPRLVGPQPDDTMTSFITRQCIRCRLVPPVVCILLSKERVCFCRLGHLSTMLFFLPKFSQIFVRCRCLIQKVAQHVELFFKGRLCRPLAVSIVMSSLIVSAFVLDHHKTCDKRELKNKQEY